MKLNSKLILSMILSSMIIAICIQSITGMESSIKTTISIDQVEDINYYGDYDGNASIMYLEFNSLMNSWLNQNSSTDFIPHNASISEKEYNLYQLDIVADNLVNGSDSFVIADNILNQISLTASIAFAQEFTAPELLSIDEIQLYLNFTVPVVPGFTKYYLVLRIFDEFFEEEIDQMWKYEDQHNIDQWVSFYPNSEIFEPGKKYNFVFYVNAEGYEAEFPINFWKAEAYSLPSQNKGYTRRFDGTRWWVVLNDLNTDLLCRFTYKKIINPADVDLKFILDNNTITPIYQESSFGAWGYEAYTSYTFETQPTNFVNVTVTANQTLEWLDVWFDITYLYLIKATGNYSIANDVITWTMHYPYEELSFGWPPPIFLFERDWNYISFLDPDNKEMEDIYFGPMDLYNESYYGIATFFSPPLERGTYIGTFTSPNYCNNINSKVKSGSDYESRNTLELGQTIKIEAEIFDTFHFPLSSGSGQIMLMTPSGQILHNETGIIPLNGYLLSSEITLESSLPEGFYQAIIFWSNGKEVAYYSLFIEVENPAKIMLYITMSFGIAVVASFIALVMRKQIKQRNWEKSLKNLFVLTKDGLSIYEYSFGIEIQDPALISAMIAALTNFVREATGSKKALKTVDQQDKKVILYHGEYITTALLADKDLPVIHKRIMMFTEAFEKEYGKGLKVWKGETSVFKGAEVIVNKYFPLDVEDQVIRGVKGKLIEYREQLNHLNDAPHIISLMKAITEFISRYRAIVNKHYLDYYNEIISIAEKKISISQ